MENQDEIVKLHAHFKELEDTAITDLEKKEAVDLQLCWKKVCKSHSEGELLAIRVGPTVEALNTIFNAFQLMRVPPDNKP